MAGRRDRLVIGKAVAAAGAGLLTLATLATAALAGAPSPASPSAAALADIPAGLGPIYRQAAASCPGLSWALLAGVGKVESDHGRSTAPGVQSGSNSAGAEGIMQFLGPTFSAYDHPIAADPARTPPAGADPPSPYDPVDAIWAAARYLCELGAPAGPHDALIAYNCGNPGPACQAASAGYAATVLDWAARYSNPGGGGPAGQVAAAAALAERGKPYQWGGQGPAAFDCSGLVVWAYAHAGIGLPRTAQAQYDAGPAVPAGAPLRRGDLVFFGSDDRHIHHVGVALGGGTGLMVDAPHTGAAVRVERIWTDTLVGRTAPVAR
jgi:cell wall-associated NlpC family hydrolase